MANERDERLRRAEKAVRQGRIDLAVAEYSALVSEQPNDLSSANALGDLLVRAGRSPDALPYYVHVADAYLREGFYSKAAGFYRKVLKFAPGDDPVSFRLAEALAAQGLLVEAKAQFAAVLAARRKRGDDAGAEDVLLRLAEINPQDVGARLDAARVLLRAGDPRGLEWLRAAADQLREAGRHADALTVLREVVDADPSDLARRAEVVRGLLDASDVDAARGLLDPSAVGQDRALLQQSAELELRAGTADAAREALARWLACDPLAGWDISQLALALPGLDDERRFLGTEAAVDAAVGGVGFETAASLLHAFVAVRPGYVPALLRLIDVCMDGGLDESLAGAQAQLAEAYRRGGALREARVVAEDLLLREPGNVSHRSLLEGILRDLGEPDPAAAIQSLFALGAEEEVRVDPTDVPVGAAPAGADPGEWTLASMDAADVGITLTEIEDEPVGMPGPASGTVEVDLTDAMNSMSGPAQEESAGAGADDDWDDSLADEEGEDDAPEDEERAIDEVFDGIRAKASTTRGVDGRQQLALGRTYLAAGLVDQALNAFARAAHDAEVRASACIALGELFEEHQDYVHAIEWFERGADAVQAEAERLDVMRRLANVLETANESVRALAVWLEIQALHPEDREAPVRVARLSTPGAGR